MWLCAHSRSKEQGFSLIEMLAAMALLAIVMTLGAVALRQYWFVQSLAGGEEEVISHLRRMQEQAVAETHPLMFGVRFRTGSPEWGAVRYDPDTGVCSSESSLEFGGGVVVSAVDFADTAEGTTQCRAQLAGAASDEFAFFFPRGTATGGTVTLQQSQLGRTESLSVTPMTGRVEEV